MSRLKRAKASNLKTKTCRFIETGCRNGENCPFAHSSSEIVLNPASVESDAVNLLTSLFSNNSPVEVVTGEHSSIGSDWQQKQQALTRQQQQWQQDLEYLQRGLHDQRREMQYQQHQEGYDPQDLQHAQQRMQHAQQRYQALQQAQQQNLQYARVDSQRLQQDLSHPHPWQSLENRQRLDSPRFGFQDPWLSNPWLPPEGAAKGGHPFGGRGWHPTTALPETGYSYDWDAFGRPDKFGLADQLRPEDRVVTRQLGDQERQTLLPPEPYHADDEPVNKCLLWLAAPETRTHST